MQRCYPGNQEKYQVKILKGTIKCSAVIASCSWLVFECWIQEEYLDVIVKQLLLPSWIFFVCVFHCEYSWRNGSWNVSATVTLKLLHCSMPSFICLYLCSKSLLGFGGKYFVFLTLMYTYENWPFLVTTTLNLINI